MCFEHAIKDIFWKAREFFQRSCKNFYVSRIIIIYSWACHISCSCCWLEKRGLGRDRHNLLVCVFFTYDGLFIYHVFTPIFYISLKKTTYNVPLRYYNAPLNMCYFLLSLQSGGCTRSSQKYTKCCQRLVPRQ